MNVQILWYKKVEIERIEKRYSLSVINFYKARMDKLILDEIDFRPRKITRYKEGHYMTKGSIYQEDTTVLNTYTPNHRVSK